MSSIHTILAELNESNSSNHKIAVFKKYKDNELLQRVLKMTYDNVIFTYGISMKNVQQNFKAIEMTLEDGLDLLERLSVRQFTGHAARDQVEMHIERLSEQDADVFCKIINRDLRINIGRTQINKIWPGLIIKPVYMRCDVYSKKTSKNIKFPAILQLKADGTYREFSVDAGKVDTRSRSGESYEYPIINQTLTNYPDGVYTGELTVRFSDNIKTILEAKLRKSKGEESEKILHVLSTAKAHIDNGQEFIIPRELGNGMINSDDIPHNDLVLDLWDYISPEEYTRAGRKNKKDSNNTPYSARFAALKSIVNEDDNVRVIETHEVNSLKEALKIVSGWMNADKEGGVLKNKGGLFKDGTSKDQLKLKLKIDCEVRITGFTPGTGKNADYFGAITFENDEKTIQGKVGVSSMTEELRDWFHANRENVIGKVMTVQFNDLTMATGNNYYALSHPRYIEIRNDKNETDTLEKVFALREMAMELGE